jgi:ketosteroid isomerase-like protein
MSQENMNVARRIADGFEAQDFDAVRRNFDSKIEWYEDPSFPEAGVYRGIDAVAEYARQFRSEFAELRYEVVELLEANAHVIAKMKVAGKGRSSGADFAQDAWWVYEFRDGKVIRCYSYLRRSEALEAAGLRE